MGRARPADGRGSSLYLLWTASAARRDLRHSGRRAGNLTAFLPPQAWKRERPLRRAFLVVCAKVARKSLSRGSGSERLRAGKHTPRLLGTINLKRLLVRHFRLTERHRSRTCLPSGYDGSLVLKTSWATGPGRSARSVTTRVVRLRPSCASDRARTQGRPTLRNDGSGARSSRP
jgi:hypothetical protein